MMQTFPSIAYKSTGIDWLPEIPTHWEMRRLKFCLKDKLKYGANESGEEYNPALYRYIRITDFNTEGKLDESNKLSLSQEKGEEYILQDGDILFARSGATVGKTFQFRKIESEEKYCYAGYLIKATPNEELLLSDFLFHFTNTKMFDNWKNSILIKATIENIGANKYSSLRIPIPPIIEQIEIVGILNSQCEKIKHFIESKQRFISLLKEQRESIITHAVTKGIDENVKMQKTVVGEIPVAWQVRRLKFLAKVNFSTVDKHNYKDEKEVWLCNYLDVYNNEYIKADIDFMKASASDAEIKRFKVEKGDVMITKDSETPEDIAVPTLVIEDLENVVCGYHLAHIKPNKDLILSEFLFRLFQSKKINSHFEVAAKGVTRYGLSYDDINSVFLPYPPILEEQQSIINYIRTETKTLDIAIAKTEKEIELMKEYREAMIAEAVTGKINTIN